MRCNTTVAREGPALPPRQAHRTRLVVLLVHQRAPVSRLLEDLRIDAFMHLIDDRSKLPKHGEQSAESTILWISTHRCDVKLSIRSDRELLRSAILDGLPDLLRRV